MGECGIRTHINNMKRTDMHRLRTTEDQLSIWGKKGTQTDRELVGRQKAQQIPRPLAEARV